MSEKYVVRAFIAFIALILIGFGLLIGWGVKKDMEYNAWAEQCNDAGYVIVDIGHYNRCMSWEEAKEKDVQFETQ